MAVLEVTISVKGEGSERDGYALLVRDGEELLALNVHVGEHYQCPVKVTIDPADLIAAWQLLKGNNNQ